MLASIGCDDAACNADVVYPTDHRCHASQRLLEDGDAGRESDDDADTRSCVDDDDCEGGRFCNEHGVCNFCPQSGECPHGNGLCDRSTGECFEPEVCEKNSHCLQPGAVCIDSDGDGARECVAGLPCESDGDCVQGHCDAGTCRPGEAPRICEPGERRCGPDELSIQACNATGRAWEQQFECEAGCGEDGQRCALPPHACLLGEDVEPGSWSKDSASGSDSIASACAVSRGPEHVYRFRVEEPAMVSIEVLPQGWDAVVDVMAEGCDPDSDLLACPTTDGASGLRSFQELLPPGNYSFSVAGYYFDTGAYTATLTIEAPDCSPLGVRQCRGEELWECTQPTGSAAWRWEPLATCAVGCLDGRCRANNNSCERAAPLSDGGLIGGSTEGAGDNQAGSCGFGDSPEVFYHLEVPDQRQGVKIGFGPEFQGYYYILDGCEVDAREQLCATPVSLGGTEASPPAVSVPAGHDDCSNVEPSRVSLEGAAKHHFQIEGSTLGGSDSYLSIGFGCGARWHTAADQVWAFEVDTPVNATFRMEGDYDTLLHLRQGGCRDEHEIACDDTLDRVSTLATSLEPGVIYYLIADGSADQQGTFQIDVELENRGRVTQTRYHRLSPGDYLLVVDGWGDPGASRAGDFTLEVESYDAVCEPGERVCDTHDTLYICHQDGRTLETQACPEGCSPGASRCDGAVEDPCEGPNPPAGCEGPPQGALSCPEDDVYAPNFEKSDAFAVRPGEIGGISCDQESRMEWFVLADLVPGDRLRNTLAFEGENAQLDLYLSGPGLAGELVGERSNAAGQSSVVHTIGPAAGGDYYVGIRNPNVGTRPTWSLEIVGTPGEAPQDLCRHEDEFWPNDRPELAAALAGAQVEGVACYAHSPVEWFALNDIPAGNSIEVELTFNGAAANLDLRLEQSGRVLDESQGISGREIVQYQTLPGEADRYLIAIRNLSPGVAVDWQLRASIRRSQQ